MAILTATTNKKLYEFMDAFAAKAKGPGVVYFTRGKNTLWNVNLQISILLSYQEVIL